MGLPVLLKVTAISPRPSSCSSTTRRLQLPNSSLPGPRLSSLINVVHFFSPPASSSYVLHAVRVRRHGRTAPARPAGRADLTLGAARHKTVSARKTDHLPPGPPLPHAVGRPNADGPRGSARSARVSNERSHPPSSPIRSVGHVPGHDGCPRSSSRSNTLQPIPTDRRPPYHLSVTPCSLGAILRLPSPSPPSTGPLGPPLPPDLYFTKETDTFVLAFPPGLPGLGGELLSGLGAPASRRLPVYRRGLAGILGAGRPGPDVVCRGSVSDFLPRGRPWPARCRGLRVAGGAFDNQPARRLGFAIAARLLARCWSRIWCGASTARRGRSWDRRGGRPCLGPILGHDDRPPRPGWAMPVWASRPPLYGAVRLPDHGGRLPPHRRRLPERGGAKMVAKCHPPRPSAGRNYRD